MKSAWASVFLLVAVVLGACTEKHRRAAAPAFRKHVKFNHLAVVVDDSTYKYLFEQLQLPRGFAWTREQKAEAGSAAWAGKYLMGINGYVEVFRPGGARGNRLGDCGLAFTTNKTGTLNAVRAYWLQTLDSVHTEHATVDNQGQKVPWFTAVSIPNVDSLRLTAWVFENAREEMYFAGFTDQDLAGEIEYANYDQHVSAKIRNVPLDSVKPTIALDRITSISLNLSTTELSRLERFLADLGFVKTNGGFRKDDFTINYSLTGQPHFLLREINFALTKNQTRQSHAAAHLTMTVNGRTATLKFRYN